MSRRHSKSHRNLTDKIKPITDRQSGAGPVFILCDLHTGYRVEFAHSVRWRQIIARGAAEIVREGRVNVARLDRRLALRSSKLADNGEPQIRNLALEVIWAENTNCPTHKICERTWRFSAKTHYAFDDVVAAKEVRMNAIYDETRSWGLPEAPRGVVVAEDWGVFGTIDYLEQKAP